MNNFYWRENISTLLVEHPIICICIQQIMYLALHRKWILFVKILCPRWINDWKIDKERNFSCVVWTLYLSFFKSRRCNIGSPCDVGTVLVQEVANQMVYIAHPKRMAYCTGISQNGRGGTLKEVATIFGRNQNLLKFVERSCMLNDFKSHKSITPFLHTKSKQVSHLGRD